MESGQSSRSLALQDRLVKPITLFIGEGAKTPPFPQTMEATMLSRFFESIVNLLVFLSEEFSYFIKTTWWPQVRAFSPSALGFGAITVVDVAHLGHSVLTLNLTGLLLGFLIFTLSKAIYVAWEERKLLLHLKNKEVRDVITSGGKGWVESWIKYIHTGREGIASWSLKYGPKTLKWLREYFRVSEGKWHGIPVMIVPCLNAISHPFGFMIVDPIIWNNRDKSWAHAVLNHEHGHMIDFKTEEGKALMLMKIAFMLVPDKRPFWGIVLLQELSASAQAWEGEEWGGKIALILGFLTYLRMAKKSLK